jgi:hypothetical protein
MHDVLTAFRQTGPDEYMCAVSYLVVRCRGCDTIGFRIEFDDYEQGHHKEDGSWSYPTEITTYPKLIPGHHEL